jgi:hypothetical protein
MQALVVKRKNETQPENAMMKVDYLSTVSGGGYIGSALTWLLKIGDRYGLDPAHFPLRGPLWGTRQTTKAQDKERQDAEARDKEAPPALDFIRQRGNFLTPGQNLNLISMIATVLRGMISTFLVYFVLLTGLFFFARHYGAFGKYEPVAPSATWPAPSLVLWAGAGAIALFVLLALIYAVSTSFGRAASHRLYQLRTWMQIRLGWLLVAIAVLLTIGTLPSSFRIRNPATLRKAHWAKFSSP